MFSTLGTIVDNALDFLSRISQQVGMDLLFVIALAVEALLVLFFIIKSAMSYESSLNRCLDKINYWLFEKKNVTEDNIRDLNQLFKSKAPKRVCYYWQQYILFREGSPSDYLSVENLIEKPLKTSSYDSNIKNLTLLTGFWALLSATFILILETNVLSVATIVRALIAALLDCLIGLVFILFLRARKNAILNTLYQNVSLFGRFMDNACVDLPSYIDYQILFTPQEIEKGQPVLREFLDYKARKEKEEFNKAKQEQIEYVSYDFSETGVDGSIVLDRAMKESERFLSKKEKILVQVSQLEAELESRRKNFDNIQKDSQTKIQASKENIQRLRQMQEETTNRIESNYYRKQQTQEAAKQEQLEQEFEQQRAKYLLEKGECEEEIKKLNDELEQYRLDVQNAMIGEYKTFFDKFCHSAELVVGKVFGDKLNALKEENEKDKETITQLEIKLKNLPEGAGSADGQTGATAGEENAEGRYDENGNYVYPNGTFYDPDGNFHDENGNVYSQDGTLISKVEKPAEEKKEEKHVVDFDSFDTFDFMTDVAQKDDIYGVAEDVVKNLDENDEFEIKNTKTAKPEVEQEPEEEEPQPAQQQTAQFEDFSLDEENAEESEPETVTEEEEVAQEEPTPQTPAKPRKKAGRPRKVVTESQQPKTAGKRGRPKKIVSTTATTTEPKRKVGRPKKIVKNAESQEQKRGRGRPKKTASIEDIDKQLTAEQAKLAKMRTSLDKELEDAISGVDNGNNSQARVNDLMKEIDKLQEEARNAMANNSSSNIEEINAKLEDLLNQIKRLNS